MAEESKFRLDLYLKHGCNMFNKKSEQSSPLSFWTEQDILEYITKYNINYCREIYGDIFEVKKFLQVDMFGSKDESQEYGLTGCKRTGCMFCMFGLEQETKANNGENRFTRMKKTHPQIWRHLMYQLGGRHVCNYMNLPWGGE